MKDFSFMGFSLQDLGKLVRPRVLSDVFLFSTKTDTQQTSFDTWWKNVRHQFLYLSNKQKNVLCETYQTNLNNLFSSLSLGDLTQDSLLQSSYVACIDSFIVRSGKNYHIIDSKEKAEIFESKIKKQFGSKTHIKIVALGLRFYKGIEKVIGDDGRISYKPIEAWETTENTNHHRWFYNEQHVLPIETIMDFEKAVPGSLVFFKQTKGMVIQYSVLRKPNFFNTSSWTNKSIKLLGGSGRSIIRFLPNKTFKLVVKDRKKQSKLKDSG